MLLGINLISATIRETLTKKIANNVDPFVGLFYLVMFGFIWLFLYQFLTVREFPQFDLVAGLAGAFFVVTFVAYLSALKISLSQSILFQSYGILITIILTAVFLGEGKYFDITTIAGLKVTGGIILAIVSLWLLLHVGRKKEEKLEKRWFFYILLVILFGGVGSFVSISTIQWLSAQEIIINQSYIMAISLFILIKVFKKNLRIGRQKTLLIFAAEFFACIAVVSFYEMLKYVAVSRILPVQQVSLVVLTMISAVVFYKESNIFSGKRLIGMVMGLVGIILLVTS